MTFPYPPDDPVEVGAVVAALRTSARAQAETVEELRRYSVRQPLPWQSAGGDAAVVEVGRLAALCDDGVTGLHSAAAALTRYREALLQARSGVDRLNQHYSAAFLRRQREAPDARGWSAELIGLERGHQAVLADLDTVSRQTAQALRHSLSPIGGGPDEAGMIRALARRLPMWEQRVATEMADTAALVLDPRHLMTPESRADLMQKYLAWQDDPVFAKELLERLGTEKFRGLLASAVPPSYRPDIGHTIDTYYGFLGHVLAAAPVSRKWLAGLIFRLSDRNNHAQRIGLGFALRYGTYRTTTLDTIVPALYSVPTDSTDVAFDDPLTGVLRALAGNPTAAGEFLRRKPGSLQILLSRIWDEDDGRALGAFLAATSTLHDDTGAAAAEFTVHWAAGHVDSLQTGISAGLGELLGNYIDDVNHGLIDLGSGAPMVENALPVTSPPPHAHFSQSDVMRALYLAMQSSAGAASIYAHQAIYSAQQIEHQARHRGPSTVLSELGVNYGRLSKIHELALVKSATRANSTEADRLRNRTSWITMSTIALGVLPIPGIRGIAVSFAKGRGINYLSRALQQQFYEKPLARDSAKRLDRADQLATEEEKATKKYIATLTKRLGADASNKWISSQSIGAGRDNAEYVLKDLT
jgi:uncharacterized protein DUF6571